MPKFFIKKAPHPKNTSPTSSSGSSNDPIKTLLAWTAASRPYRRRDRSYYTTIAILVILAILILFLAQEYMLIGALLALVFVTYVLGFVPPEDTGYRISAQGVTIGDHFYFWEDLHSFWFSEKEGHKTLNIMTRFQFPGQLILLLGDSSEEEVKEAVARYLPFHEIPPKSWMDKWAEGLQKHFPLENPHR